MSSSSPANNSNGGANILDELTSKAPPNTTLPPRNIRDIVEKTAGYIVRNGPNFVEKLIAGQGSNPRMSFLYPEDAYHPYYQWRLAEIKAGRVTAMSAGRDNETVGASMKGREAREQRPPPEEFRFSARMPNISAQDLEVVKLTALFVAKNGRSFMTALSQREAGNYQFDFLRPQHTLYQFFSRLLDQYTELLASEGGEDDGQASAQYKMRIEELEASATDRFHVLNRARRRAEWLKQQEAQKSALAEQDEKEKLAFAQIDWHDFVVVETVVFDEADEQADLPGPTSLNDLQSASLEQKAAMRVSAGKRIEEAMPGMEDWDAFYGGQQQHQTQYQSPAPAVQMPPPPQQHVQPQHAYPTPRQQQQTQSQPLKIRDASYVPRAQTRKGAAAQLPPNTSLCAICGDAFLNDDMPEHMRIEMLDPNWREQHDKSVARSATTNLSTQDVAQNLKRLASQRSDVFVNNRTGASESGGGADGGVDDEERKRRRRAEMGQYDGVSGVPSPAALAGMLAGGGLMPTQQGGLAQGVVPGSAPGTTDVQEQIRSLHQRFGS